MTVPIPPRIPPSLLWKVIEWLRVFFRRPRKEPTLEDVDERNAAFQALRDMVSQETAALSARIQELLDQSIAYYNQLGEHELFVRYQLSTKGAVRQLELVKSHVPVLIDIEAARQLSGSNPGCAQLRRMLPGQERERRMGQFISDVIQAAIQRCEQTVTQAMEAVQEDLLDALASAQTAQQQRCERQAEKLQELLESQEDPATRQMVLNQARCTLQCCAHIETQLKEVV